MKLFSSAEKTTYLSVFTFTNKNKITISYIFSLPLFQVM